MIRRSRRGVTLLELLVVVGLVSLLAGISFPAVSAGLDSLRLRSAGDQIVSFLHLGLTVAERREQTMELKVSRATNRIMFRSAAGDFERTLDLPESVSISAVFPSPPEAKEVSILLYPGGSFPRVRIEITNRRGAQREVSIDPVSGVPVVGVPAPPAGESDAPEGASP